MDTDALTRTFQPYMTHGFLNAAAINEAYEAKDKYGQALPLPPRKLLMSQVDTSGDGELSTEELKAWKGYEGQAYCRNPGDAMYGCLDRCIGGTENINGDPGYFENYKASTNDFPEADEEFQVHVRSKYTGGFSKAQRMALKEFTKNHPAGNGAFVLMGGKDMHQWRIYYDMMKNVSDTSTEIHVYDPFTGFPECDHSKDTGMCPPAGSAAPHFETFQKEIAEFGDASRVQIHKIESYENIPAKEFPNKVAMVMIDVSLYKDVLEAIKSVDSRLHKGSVIFIHDFGWEGYTGVEKAVNEYLKTAKGNQVELVGGPDGVACYLAKIVVTA